MSISIQLVAGGQVVEGRLYTTVTALKVVQLLPLELQARRRGGCYLASLRRPLGAWLDETARAAMKPGELAWWPPENALCVAFAAAASVEGEAAAANPIGVLTGDVGLLRGLPEEVTLRLERSPGPGRGATSGLPSGTAAGAPKRV